MASGNPYPAPPPLILAKRLARLAWRDDIDDRVRLDAEWSSDTIKAQNLEIGRMKHRIEQLEAENETYAALLYGGEGGCGK